MPEEIEPVWLPWPDRTPACVFRVGEKVSLEHVGRPDWTMEGRIVQMTHRRWSVQVLPDEPITSPANWKICGVHDDD